MIRILGVGMYTSEDRVIVDISPLSSVIPGQSYIVLEVDGVEALSSFTKGGHEVIHETGESFPETIAWIIHKWIFPGAGE